ncbi:MAG: hypothetical protein ACYC96_07515 [Fimbriimonadaceae bacterium]
MITCPNCKASLPDWAKNCQFCQADTSQVIRPTQTKPNAQAFTTPAWTLAAYYAVSGLITIQSVVEIVSTIVGSKHGVGPFEVIILVWYGLSAVIGIGLLLRVSIIRAFVNFVCYLNIGCGLLSLAGALFGTLFSAYGLIFVLLAILQIAEYGFMIFLIGETDRVSY